jgi:hypothetical protein
MENVEMEDVECVMYEGKKFRIQSSGRYYQSYDRHAKHRLLHRRVWSDHNGDIPEGHHIHHKDGNWRNNDISNLEAVLGIEHQRQHMLERLSDPEYREQNRKNLDKAILKAAEWHKSEAGLAWHKQHGERSWENRLPEKCICKVCSKEFEGFFNAEFCSKSCRQKGCYAKQKTQPQTCVWCNKDFLANKYRKIECCSCLCANRKRAANKSIQSDSSAP